MDHAAHVGSPQRRGREGARLRLQPKPAHTHTHAIHDDDQAFKHCSHMLALIRVMSYCLECPGRQFLAMNAMHLVELDKGSLQGFRAHGLAAV